MTNRPDPTAFPGMLRPRQPSALRGCLAIVFVWLATLALAFFAGRGFR